MLNIREGLTFADVLLVPKYSEVETRANVDLSVELSKGIKLSVPIIPANMKSLLNMEAAWEFYKLGSMAIMHRFAPIEEQFNWAREVKSWDNGFGFVGFSIGGQPADYEIVDEFISIGAKILCVDLAHGHSRKCIEITNYITKKHPQVFLISGNTCTPEGATALWEAGADAVKKNVGAGSICTTRIMTGNGYPQLQALVDAAEVKPALEKKLNKKLFMIADGGMANSGELVKSLCFAELAMTGNMFSGALETPGELISFEGKEYKSYVGSSTLKITKKHIEGVESLVPAKGKIADIMEGLCDGVRSGCSYQGVSNLTDLRKNPQFVRVTQSGIKESHAHDVLVVK